jgi:hypothetical protein
MTSLCPTEDLTLHAFGFLEGDACARVEAHVRTCRACQERMAELLAERDLTALVLAEDEKTRNTVPGTVRQALPPRRRLPLLAAAAVLLVGAALGAWAWLRTTAPEESGWHALPDGSRYRVVAGARFEETEEPRMLALDDGSLLVEVRPGGSPFAVETPHGSVRSEAGRFAVSVAPEGTVLEVLEGRAWFEAAEGVAQTTVPGAQGEIRILIYELDPDPALLARVRELEARLRDLGAMEEEPPTPPATAEEALDRFDWGGLATSLAETLPELRRGRLPGDPEALRRYLRQVEELARLAEALGVDPSLDALARDPRTGSRLFAAAVRQRWPDAPQVDLDRARAAAETALAEHASATARAETEAARAAADEKLRENLQQEVESLEELHGEPKTTVDPVETIAPTKESFPSTETTPQNTDTEPKESGALAPDSSTSTSLESTAIRTSSPRVLRGSVTWIASEIVRGWGGSPRDRARLEGLAADWIRGYRSTLEAAPSRVVAALEAELRGELATTRATASEISRLRARLLEVQAEVESRLPAGSTPAPPTHLLLEG